MIAGLVRLVSGESEMTDYLFFGLSMLFFAFFVVTAIYYGFRLIREKSLSNAKGAVACTTLISVSSVWQWADQLFPEYHGVFLGLLLGTAIYIIGVRILVLVESFHIRYFTHEEPIDNVPVRELISKSWAGILAFMLFVETTDRLRDLLKDGIADGQVFWYGWTVLVPVALAVVFYQIVGRFFKLRSDTEPSEITRPSKPVDETGSGGDTRTDR